jgi:hypothetical protein
MKKDATTVNLRLPTEIVCIIDKDAKENFASRNSEIKKILVDYIKNRQKKAG